MPQISLGGPNKNNFLHYKERAKTTPANDKAGYQGITFAAGDEITLLTGLPTMGADANLVNTPVSGQDYQFQGNAQPIAPNITVSVLFNEAAHGFLFGLQNDGKVYDFQFRRYAVTPTADAKVKALSAAPNTPGGGTDPLVVSEFYWSGTIASFQWEPQLVNNQTATLTIASLGNLYGPFATA